MKPKKEEQRIKSDIVLFRERARAFVPSSAKEREILELAGRYCEDAQHYLEKKDYITAFGCANYAHGLLDALRSLRGQL